jgi:hypothetical protein
VKIIDLKEQIDMLTRRESEQKLSIENGFSEFEKQMTPGQVAKRIFKNSLIKIKSFLPIFSPKTKV